MTRDPVAEQISNPVWLAEAASSAARAPISARRRDRFVALIAGAVLCGAICGCGDPPVTVTLTYEVDRQALGHQRAVDMESLVDVINRRLFRRGKARHSQDETILVGLFGDVDEKEIQEIDRIIRTHGALEFRILADVDRDAGLVQQAAETEVSEIKHPEADARTDVVEHELWIELAKRTHEDEVSVYDRERARWITITDPNEVAVAKGDTHLVTRTNDKGQLQKLVIRGEVYAEWIAISEVERVETGQPPQLRVPVDEFMCVRTSDDDGVEVLVLVDDLNVNGGHISSAETGLRDERVCVNFDFNTEGAKRFGSLTSANVMQAGRKRRMGVIIDKQLLSAPALNTVIRESGQITGDFTLAEVDWLAAVLRASQLPYPVRKVGQRRDNK